MVWLLLLGLLGAEPDEARVLALVERLGSESFAERQTAQARLAAYGEAIVPVLQRVRSPDPDVQRLVRGLTRASRRMRVTLQITEVPTLAKPLRFQVRVVNDTDYSYRLPLVQPRGGSGLRSAISLLLFREGRPEPIAVPIPVDALKKITPPLAKNTGVLLRPGEAMRLEFELKGHASPLRRPGRTKLGAIYEGEGAMVWYGYRQRVETQQGETTAVAVRSPPLTFQTLGRTPKEIAAALAGRDPFVRDEAIKELLLRDDEAMLPLLRKHALERELTLTAIQRLGAGGADEDFSFIYKMTRHEDAPLRRAAVSALANYKRRRARARLISLAQDHGLKHEALVALQKHKHYATIDLFVRLLRAGTVSREHSRLMRDTLFDWTDRIIDDRESEIRAFERWWRENRTAWRKRNG